MTKNKEPIKVKIDGESFAKIKAADEQYQNVVKEAEKAADILSEQANAAKDAFWKTVYEVAGVSKPDQDKSFCIDKKHADLGIYVLEEKAPKSCGGFGDFMKAMLKDGEMKVEEVA